MHELYWFVCLISDSSRMEVQGLAGLQPIEVSGCIGPPSLITRTLYLLGKKWRWLLGHFLRNIRRTTIYENYYSSVASSALITVFVMIFILVVQCQHYGCWYFLYLAGIGGGALMLCRVSSVRCIVNPMSNIGCDPPACLPDWLSVVDRRWPDRRWRPARQGRSPRRCEIRTQVRLRSPPTSGLCQPFFLSRPER